MHRQRIAQVATCPCGSGIAYIACCEKYHLGSVAPTAEALMRSRYSAYVFHLEDYLLQSWHPDTRPTALHLSDDAATKWLGLDVKQHNVTSEDSATVEFVARYKVAGKASRLHEISRFLRMNGRWLYLDGEHPP